MEDEHNVSAPAQHGMGLQLQDLLNATDLDEASRKQLQKLVAKPQVRAHRCREHAHTGPYRQNKEAYTMVQVVSARLPKAIQQRQERKAAYVSSSKESSKWMPLVQANRQAPTLRLTADAEVSAVSTAAGLASKHAPVSQFEQEIADMLRAAGHQSAASAAQVPSFPLLQNTHVFSEPARCNSELHLQMSSLIMYSARSVSNNFSSLC